MMAGVSSGLDFLRSQASLLGPHEFVVVAPSGQPMAAMEIGRDPDGAYLVRVPARLDGRPFEVAVRTQLVERGFASDDPANPHQPWDHTVADAESAVDLSVETLQGIFGAELGDAIDLAHGSHQAEFEAQQKLAAVRAFAEPVLASLEGHPCEIDEDGDYLLPMGDMQVYVAPRVMPHAPVILRVFAITNLGVTIGPELGLFLARLNFGLTFGRFALDIEHQSIWFDETLLGEQTTDEELRFTIQVVAETANEWAPKIRDMFGGSLQADARSRHDATLESGAKPGSGGYL
jgi:hypothetical protein